LSVNVPNVPAGQVKGVLPTRLGKRVYRDELVLVDERDGQQTYRLEGPLPTGELLPGTDVAALAESYISITPLHLDLTAHRFLEEMREWAFGY
jgi:5'-nucleotidase